MAAEKQELGDRPSGGLWAWALALAEARISQSVGDGGARTVGAIFTGWILRALEPPKRSTCKNNTNETIRALVHGRLSIFLGDIQMQQNSKNKVIWIRKVSSERHIISGRRKQTDDD